MQLSATQILCGHTMLKFNVEVFEMNCKVAGGKVETFPNKKCCWPKWITNKCSKMLMNMKPKIFQKLKELREEVTKNDRICTFCNIRVSILNFNMSSYSYRRQLEILTNFRARNRSDQPVSISDWPKPEVDVHIFLRAFFGRAFQ